MTFIRNLFAKNEHKLFVLFDQAIVSGSNFIIGILIARFLGIEQFGVYGFIYLIYLLCLGLQQAFFIIPMYSLGPAYSETSKEKYLYNLMIIQIFFAVLISIISLFSLTVIPIRISPEIYELRFVIALTVGVILLQDFIRRSFLFRGFFKLVIMLDSIAYIFQMISLVLVYNLGDFNLEICLKILGLSMLVSVAYGLFVMSHLKFKIPVIKDIFIKHWRFSKWLLARSILTYSSGNFFIIVGGSILGPVAIGAIKMGQNLQGLMNVIFLAIENHVPIVSAYLYRDKGKQALYTYLKRTTLKSLLICISLGVSIVVFSSWLISNLYGDDYREYAYVLIVFAVVNLIVCITMPLRFALRTFEKTKPLFFATVLSAIFGFLLAYPLIETFQMQGLLSGLIISQLIGMCYLFYAVYKSKSNLALSA